MNELRNVESHGAIQGDGADEWPDEPVETAPGRVEAERSGDTVVRTTRSAAQEEADDEPFEGASDGIHRRGVGAEAGPLIQVGYPSKKPAQGVRYPVPSVESRVKAADGLPDGGGEGLKSNNEELGDGDEGRADATDGPAAAEGRWDPDKVDRLDEERVAERHLPEIGKTVANSVTQERWTGRPSERQSMLREALRTVGEGYGLRQLPDLQFGEGCSSFGFTTGIITLDEDLLSGVSPTRAIEDLAHEARHCYQRDAVAGSVDGDMGSDVKDVWREAIENYPKIDEYADLNEFFRDYWDNPIERDARSASARVVEGFISSKSFSLGDLFIAGRPGVVQDMPPVPVPPGLEES